MKRLSDFVESKAFALAMLVLMSAVAIGLFQATLHLAK